MKKKQKKMLARIIVAFALLLVLNVLDRLNVFSAIPGKVPLKMILYVADYLIIGYDILKKAGKGIWNRQVFDENFLIL